VNPELVALAVAQGDVFSARQAAEHGLDAAQIRRLLATGAIRSVRQSIYCLAHLLDGDPLVRHRVQVAAALLARGNPVAEGRPTLVGGSLSAAALWRLTVPTGLRNLDPGSKVTTIRGPGSGSTPWVPRAIHLISGDRVRRTYRSGVRVCPAALAPVDIAFQSHVPRPRWHGPRSICAATRPRGMTR
jgi:hypothetical protein